MTNWDEFEINAVVQRWSDSIGVRLERPLTPIYREGHRHPELFGSGVLIRIEDLVFLVSAAHVVDQVRGGPHYFSANGHLINLPSLRLTSPLTPGTSRDDDRVDLGYWVLDPDKAAQVTSADTLTLGDLDPGAIAPDRSSAQFFVNGYPSSRQPRRLDGDEFEMRSLAFVTDELDPSEYSAAGITQADSLLVDFDKRDVYREGKRVTGPDLFGVSGGVIWRVTGPMTSSDCPRLTAIVTSWRRQQPFAIIGTRIHVWIASAAKDFPAQFRRALERLRAAAPPNERCN